MKPKQMSTYFRHLIENCTCQRSSAGWEGVWKGIGGGCNSNCQLRSQGFLLFSPVMKDLHWLPVKYRIMFKLVVYTFKALHGSAPTYIRQLIRLKPQSNYNLRSNTKHFSTARSAQQDQEDNRRQGVLCSCADPMERPSR